MKIARVAEADIDRITSRLYLTEGDRSRNLSGFWVLLALAAVIATAGVIADSTATVIGAMIVAPLMTPILGTALAIVLADRRRIQQNLALVLGGALAVVLIAVVVGLFDPVPITAASNSQVAGRIHPRLIDLVAALATGLVGAFALLRDDISDALPGVAIAISLVPPLAVVGLSAESGQWGDSVGALLLFATNVAAIIATGTLLLLAAGIRRTATAAGRPVGQLRGRTLAVVVSLLVLVAVPLGYGSVTTARAQFLLAKAEPIASRWAEDQGWRVSELTYQDGHLALVAVGRPPEADADSLRDLLDAGGLQDVDMRVTLVLGGTEDLPAAARSLSASGPARQASS